MYPKLDYSFLKATSYSLKSKRGGVTIWLIGIIPILAIVLALFVNVILMIDARVRLQGALDRGVYAGASYLAHVMNEVAGLNKDFLDEYLEKKKALGEPSQENKQWIEEQVSELNYNQGGIYNDMLGLLETGYQRAHQIALDVIVKNLSGAPHITLDDYKIFYGRQDEPMFEMVNDGPDEGPFENIAIIRPVEITGESYDPKDYRPHSYKVHKYLVKDNGYYVALASGVVASFRPPLLPEFFTGGDGLIRVHTVSAAQPYGGSIKEYAHTAADGLLYHPALIPFAAVGEDLDE